MSKITITEALAELKTIDKRLAKKREFVQKYLARQDIVKDPLEKDGGSVTALQQERQAIGDLEERKIAIRRAIAETNASTRLSVNGALRSVADWLVWRREVAPTRQQFLAGLNGRIQAIRDQTVKQGASLVESGAGKRDGDIVVNVPELELAEDIEELEEVLGNLDGKLSLANATTFVDVAD